MSSTSRFRAAAAAPVSPAIALRLVPAAAAPAAGPGVPGQPSGARPRPLVPAGSAGPAPLEVVDEGREIRAVCRSTVQAAIEVLAGTRPAQQLARRLDQRCLAALQHRAALTRRVASTSSPTAGRLHRNPSVRSVRSCRVSEDVYEASAVVVDELRVRAVALRLERNKLVWRITALEIG
jgi:hypothetical protein